MRCKTGHCGESSGWPAGEGLSKLAVDALSCTWVWDLYVTCLGLPARGLVQDCCAGVSESGAILIISVVQISSHMVPHLMASAQLCHKQLRNLLVSCMVLLRHGSVS